MEIFIRRNNEKHGPYSLDQIHAFLAMGQVQGSDQAWHEGMASDESIFLSQVPGVQLPLKAVTPPPPPQQSAPAQNVAVPSVATQSAPGQPAAAAPVHSPSMRFGTAIIITLLSVIALAAEFALYMFLGFGAAVSGDTKAVSGVAAFFVGLMVLTGVAGLAAPISSLVEIAVKKKNSGIYTFLSLLGLTGLFLINVGLSKQGQSEAASESTAATTGQAASPAASSAGSSVAPAAGSEAKDSGDAAEDAYRSQVSLREITLGKTVLDEDGVFGEIKNKGRRTLKDVEITVYALGKDGNPVWDTTFHPVTDSKFAFGDAGDPLKPNYSRKFGYKLEAPSDWNKKVRVEVTKVQFADGDAEASASESSAPEASSGPSESGRSESGLSEASTAVESPARVKREVSRDDERDRLLARYNQWQRAWMRQDLDTFLSFYSKEVQIKDSDGVVYGLRTLRNRRGERWKNETDITIEDEGEPTIEIEGDRATMDVNKTYNSSLSNYVGQKHLVWTKSGGRWLIAEESFTLWEGGRKE